MNYWLMKTEPGTYSWEDLENDKKTFWDGVRNYQARNNMKDMKKGDQAFIYHSVKEKKIIGVAEIIKEAYQDPTTDDDRWVAVDIKPLFKLDRPIELEEVKNEDHLSGMVLVNNSRLSVQQVSREEFDKVIEMSKE